MPRKSGDEGPNAAVPAHVFGARRGGRREAGVKQRPLSGMIKAPGRAPRHRAAGGRFTARGYKRQVQHTATNGVLLGVQQKGLGTQAAATAMARALSARCSRLDVGIGTCSGLGDVKPTAAGGKARPLPCAATGVLAVGRAAGAACAGAGAAPAGARLRWTFSAPWRPDCLPPLRLFESWSGLARAPLGRAALASSKSKGWSARPTSVRSPAWTLGLQASMSWSTNTSFVPAKRCEGAAWGKGDGAGRQRRVLRSAVARGRRMQSAHAARMPTLGRALMFVVKRGRPETGGRGRGPRGAT